MRSAVIPDTEVDDPIIRNPITLVGVDYEGGQMVFTLSAVPPPAWILAFQNPRGSWGEYVGASPGSFNFLGSKALVRLSPGMNPQQLVDHTKTYTRVANEQYVQNVQSEHRNRLAAEREQLRRQIAEQERRQQILSHIKLTRGRSSPRGDDAHLCRVLCLLLAETKGTLRCTAKAVVPISLGWI